MKWLATVAFVALSHPALSAPVLYFHGDLVFSSTTDTLSLMSSVTQVTSNDLGFDSSWEGANLQLESVFVGASSDSMRNFADISGASLTNEFQLTKNASEFVTGEAESIMMSGFTGMDFGVLEGLLTLTAPASLTGQNLDLFSLQLNMTEVFSETLWESNFAATVDGVLSSSSDTKPATVLHESNPVWLLMLGLGCLIATGVKRHA